MNDALYIKIMNLILGSGLPPDVIEDTLRKLSNDYKDYLTIKRTWEED